jgi:uncharacterized protein (DUF2141 family)
MAQRLQATLSLLTVIGAFTTAWTAHASRVSNLTVEIDGLKNRDGQVCLSVFSSSRGFPNQDKEAIQSQCTSIADLPVRVTFKDLRPGNYAVAVLHDANADNKANRNFFGVPTEGFGFSRNPAIRTRAPKFGESVFLVAGVNTDVQIQLQYLFGY